MQKIRPSSFLSVTKTFISVYHFRQKRNPRYIFLRMPAGLPHIPCFGCPY